MSAMINHQGWQLKRNFSYPIDNQACWRVDGKLTSGFLALIVPGEDAPSTFPSPVNSGWRHPFGRTVQAQAATLVSHEPATPVFVLVVINYVGRYHHVQITHLQHKTPYSIYTLHILSGRIPFEISPSQRRHRLHLIYCFGKTPSDDSS